MKKLNLLLLLSSFGLLTACGQNSHGSNTPTQYTPEQILNNFLNKIDENNYSIDSPDYLHTDVYSDEFIRISLLGSVYYYMNTNPQELYYAKAYEDDTELDISKISFRGKQKALEAAPSEYLISHWKEQCQDNIWEVFTNHPDDELRFSLVNDSNIFAQVLGNLGNVPHEFKADVTTIDVVMDNPVPTKANIEINFDEEVEDIKGPLVTTINFGIKREKTIVDSWLEDPNRTYPKSKTSWDDNDEFAFNSVFYRIRSDKMDDVIPFPSEFASRTFYRYPNETFVMNFYATDTLAKKEDVDKYTSKLIKDYGYEKHSELIDGVIVDRYDKFLYDYEDIYHAYSSIYISYTEEDGVELLLEQSYNQIKYQGRGSLNYFLKDMKFLPLPQSDYLTNYEFYDETFIQNESYMFLTTYKKALNVTIKYTNEAQAEAYLEAYYTALEEQGFNRKNSYISKTTGEQYSSRLSVGLDGENIHMVFWYVEYYSDEYAIDWMNSYQFPLIDVTNHESLIKDATLYYMYDAGIYQKDILSIDLEFFTVDERETYASSYIDTLLANGFVQYDPISLRIARRDTAYYNASKGIIVAFDNRLINNQNIDFHLIKVSDDFQPK